MTQPITEKTGIKLAIIAAIILLLMIPIAMITDLIDERSASEYTVQQEIARSTSGTQALIAPFIYAEYETSTELDGVQTRIKHQRTLLPEQLTVQGTLDTFEKYRSIYKAQLYRADLTLTGHFDPKQLDDLADLTPTRVALVLGVSDIRGIGLNTQISLNRQTYTLRPGTTLSAIEEGVHITLPISALRDKDLAFDIQFDLQGMTSLSIAPLGARTEVSLEANWPHPSFQGEYLPVHSEITATHFNASWQTSYFATNMKELFSRCIFKHQCAQLESRNMGVRLVEPVDHYLKSHRATNYALLVIILVISSFFLLELSKTKAIHPVQYGFVGLSLAVFYLLLISLSEHLGFGWAYALSALAAILLLVSYIWGILQSAKLSACYLIALSTLYAMLYAMLSAEHYALLLGSLLCFTVLATIMLATRHVNWYGTAQASTEKLPVQHSNSPAP
ncbi:cell envelope integrity protein CreD [Pseudoalteromonas sp. McH1-42]|uniref:cell envelope integrity protein CreD n=1 Tax=Pseudoalteromonas sp. McH1-42 TaxID=2917752 RepID=UPI001EF42947|nr:cell envelope integrity protein CreD [Pseudoalteromonas sp. McH1-42]MCG7562968.1 cell envelope integrity protein CreD [Pseudoalteromonas sp. McH1-42]